MRYSLCITNRNSVGTIRQSLDSLLGQLDEAYEVVVVDSISTDGSERVLREYQERGKLKLISQKCSRGVGRQLAFENSSGDYVFSHLDMDEIFTPVLREFAKYYHEKCEGNLLVGIRKPGDWRQNTTLAPRLLIEELGGWRDLQYAEDWDLWSRAAKAGKYAWTVFPMLAGPKSAGDRYSRLGKLRFRYGRYRDELRLGRRVFQDGESVTIAQRTMLLAAELSAPLHRSFHDSFNQRFSCSDPMFMIPQNLITVDGES